MKTNIALLSDLLPYPYALFKDDTCIFESKLADTYILKSLMKNIGSETQSDTISIKYFRGFVFFAIKSLHTPSDYTLITVLKERQTNLWSENDWDKFYRLFQTAAYLISIEDLFPILKIGEVSDTHKQPSDDKEMPTYSEFNTDFQDNYQLELTLISLLKKGDTQTINLLLRKLISINKSQLSVDSLTDKKYKLVAFLTIITRTSIKQGCSANLAYRLSDSLIQRLDTLTTTEEVKLFTEHMLLEFSNLNKDMPNNYASDLVNSAIAHVHANLYEVLSNHDIANCLSVHPSYLSTVFKKVTGSSLHHYIISEKISEAQYLLANTDFPLSIISELLHFSNQSHFCKLFKAHTSYTPKEFRIWF